MCGRVYNNLFNQRIPPLLEVRTVPFQWRPCSGSGGPSPGAIPPRHRARETGGKQSAELPPCPGRLGPGCPLMSWKVGQQLLALTGAGRPGWHPPLDHSLEPKRSNRTSRAPCRAFWGLVAPHSAFLFHPFVRSPRPPPRPPAAAPLGRGAGRSLRPGTNYF